MNDRDDRTASPVYPGPEEKPGAYGRYSRALWDEQENYLTALHEVWVQNLLYLSNRQWWRRNSLGVWAPERVPSWRKQPTSNISLAFFKTFLAKSTKVRPAWQVIPASGAPNDIKAAELSDEVLEAKWRELKLGAVLRRAIGWAITTGNGFLLPYWNEYTGRIRPLEIEQEHPVLDADGRQTGTETVMVPVDEDGEPLPKGAEPIMVDEGDVGVRAPSPFSVRVNPEAENDDEVTWFIVAEAMTLRKIKERWPDHVDMVKAEDTGTLDDHERMLTGVLGVGDNSSVLSGDDRLRDEDLPKALVLHYHERATTEFPDGRFWVATQDVELEEPTGLPDGFWPALVHIGDVEIPGQYYHAATLSSIVPLNREYNEINRDIQEHHALMAKGKWMVPRGAGIGKQALTSQPGEIVEHMPGFKPAQADIRPLPDGVYKERERILADWEMVGGVHKISMGKPPPGVTAGVAFLQLQEADDTDMGPFLAQLEEAVATLARAILTIIRARYDDERLAYVPGPDRRYLVKAFRGADLEGAVDVIPVAESSFPWSKTAKQSMMLELAVKVPQMFMDPQTGQFDTAKFSRLLPVGGLDSLAAGQDLDIQEALREEEMFAEYGTSSNELPISPIEAFWQDHQAHYRQHVQKLKSEEFKEWSPQAQVAYIQHVQEHDLERMQAMMTGTDSQAGQEMAASASGEPVNPEEVEGNAPPPPPARDLADDLEADLLAGV